MVLLLLLIFQRASENHSLLTVVNLISTADSLPPGWECRNRRLMKVPSPPTAVFPTSTSLHYYSLYGLSNLLNKTKPFFYPVAWGAWPVKLSCLTGRDPVKGRPL